MSPAAYSVAPGFEMALDFLPGAFWRNEYRFAYYMPMNDRGQLSSVGITIPGTEGVQPTVQTVTTSFVSIGTASCTKPARTIVKKRRGRFGPRLIFSTYLHDF
jgi:hypothetical protein